MTLFVCWVLVNLKVIKKHEIREVLGKLEILEKIEIEKRKSKVLFCLEEKVGVGAKLQAKLQST